MAGPKLKNRPASKFAQKETRERAIVTDAMLNQRYPGLTLKKLKNERTVNYEYLITPLIKEHSAKYKNFIEAGMQAEDALKKLRLSRSQARDYLNEIFQAENRVELDKKILASSKVPSSSITPDIRKHLYLAHAQYRAYRKHLIREKAFQNEYLKERKGVMAGTVEKAKSAAGAMATFFKKVENRWHGMDGKEKLVSGITLLFAAAWFLNSEKSAKLRETASKMLKLGIGFYAANTASKLFLKRKVTDLAYMQTNKFAGTHDIYRKAFDASQEEAEFMVEGIKALGPLKVDNLFKRYLDRKALYKKNPNIHDAHKELTIGSVEMDGKHIWKVLSVFDRKYDIKGLYAELNKAKAEAKRKGIAFQSPSFADIAAAAMMKNVAFKYEKGKVRAMKVSAAKTETKFEKEPTQLNSTKAWWVLSGQPHEWKMRAYYPDHYGKNIERKNHIEHITSYTLRNKQPLSDFIKEEHLKRYTRGFKNLYNLKYKNAPTRNTHLHKETSENVVYATSRVSVDYKTHIDTNKAHVVAVSSAYTQGMEALKRSYERRFKGNDKKRFNEYAQPVHGVFLTDAKGNYTNYVLFMRLVLPKSKTSDLRAGSLEHNLRKKRLWADGSAVEMHKQTPMKSGEILRWDEFVTISKNLGPVYESAFGKKIRTKAEDAVGAIESFLAKTGLKSTEKAKINKVLAYFSKIYAGKGITKEGFVAILASRTYKEKELINILGGVPLPGLEIHNAILERTKKVVNSEKTNLSKEAKQQLISDLMTAVGNDTVMTCYQDMKSYKYLLDVSAKINLTTIPVIFYALRQIPNKTSHLKNAVLPQYEVFLKHLIKYIDKLSGKQLFKIK